MSNAKVWGFAGQTLSVIVLSACAHAAEGDLSMALKQLEQWRNSRKAVYMNDFGEIGRYRAANAKLKPPAAGENRVVFFGDSITDIWPLEASFPGKPYVNRGIGGQTTTQLLVRFRHDVIALRPKVVVILAGTNDIAGNTGPMTAEDTQANFTSMVELARANGIKVVLSSILPVHNYTPSSGRAFPLRPPEKIVALNGWLKRHAAASGCVYLDYFAAVVDGRGWLKRELAPDGLHPTKVGYAVMAPLAQQAIDKAIGGG